MNLLTINALSKKTGISSHEIRRRTRNGTLPHVRVGATTRAKILIDEDTFNELIRTESINNAKVSVATPVADNSNDDIGYDKIRRIG